MLNVTDPNCSSVSKIDIGKCILCQKNKKLKDSKRLEYVSGTDVGRQQILSAAEVLFGNERSERVLRVKTETFKYHSTSCYAKFMKESKRKSENLLSSPIGSNAVVTSTPGPSHSARKKRQKSDSKNVCVVCGHDRIWDKKEQKQARELFRISEEYSAQKLLNAAEVNQDDVYTRIVFCYEDGVKAIFAEDTFYHGNCL